MSNKAQCTGKGAPGLNEHCYHTGYSHGDRRNNDRCAISDGIAAAPCTTNKYAAACYDEGYKDGVRASNNFNNNSKSTSSSTVSHIIHQTNEEKVADKRRDYRNRLRGG